MFCHITRRIISVKIGLFFQEITFRTVFPGSNYLLPTFLTGGKWDLEVENLLLSNPESYCSLSLKLKVTVVLCP